MAAAKKWTVARTVVNRLRQEAALIKLKVIFADNSALGLLQSYLGFVGHLRGNGVVRCIVGRQLEKKRAR